MHCEVKRAGEGTLSERKLVNQIWTSGKSATVLRMRHGDSEANAYLRSSFAPQNGCSPAWDLDVQQFWEPRPECLTAPSCAAP